MRVLALVGALVASSLIHGLPALAAGYGSSDGGSGANGYGEPGRGAQGDSSATLEGLPAASATGPTCVVQATTTVFVTVYPTSPASAAGASLSAAEGPEQTFHRTVRVSPVGSHTPSHSHSFFTTVTVDLWGHGSGSNSKSAVAVSGPGSASRLASDVSPSSQGSPAGDYGHSAGAAWPRPTVTADAAGPGGAGPGGASDGTADDGQSPVGTKLTAAPYASANAAQASLSDNGPNGAGGNPAWRTVVTDTEVHWVVGPEGPTPVTVLSEHTIFGSGPTGAPTAGDAVTCLTTTGPDGRPTVLEWPAGRPQASGGPVVTVAGVPSDNGGVAAQAFTTLAVPPATVAASNAASTTCTTYTVLGTDGVPTIVHSSWLVPAAAPVTAAPGPLPTDGSGSAQAQNGPEGPGVTTCTTFTVLGPDGKLTVVESTLVLPGTAAVAQGGTPGNVPGGAPAQVTSLLGVPGPVIPNASELPDGGHVTCTTFTVLGADGLPTVVDATYVVPGPATTPFPTVVPGGIITGAPSQITGSGVLPQPGGVGVGPQGSTTCITFTTLGADGRPTVVESTLIVPTSNVLPSATVVGLPSLVSQQGSPLITSPGGPVTTCLTFDVLGPNGVATPVVRTVVFTPAALPSATTVGYPSMAAQQQSGDLPQGIPPFASSNGAVTTCVTVNILGPNGVATPVVQTIVLTPSAAGLGLPTAPPAANAAGFTLNPSGPVVQGGSPDTLAPGAPGLDAYGQAVPNPQTLLPPSAVFSGLNLGTLTGPLPAVVTVVAAPAGQPGASGIAGLPFPYGAGSDGTGVSAAGVSAGDAGQNAYGWNPNNQGLNGLLSLAPITVTTLQTRTWTNFIPQPTTTYTMNFPLTTLETMTLSTPLGKRVVRRQQSSLPLDPAWGNFTVSPQPTTTVPSVSVLFSQPPATPSLPSAPGAGNGGASPPMCPFGGQIGNMTVDFDDIKPGPLFNPSGDVWFSEGFLVAPPTAQEAQSFAPSSGGQLVEFVPPSLANLPLSHQGTGDTAEVGVGPNAANPCFRFDFFGAKLGCAALASEGWCEFEVSAYRFDPGVLFEQSIAWSETKRIPACANFPSTGCPLTPVEFEGYTNITSVLINVRVGLELRAWWGDDFKFGWTDNSCEASSCRALAAPQHVKRETVELALRRGVWHWTPAGLQRLDDGYIWESAH